MRSNVAVVIYPIISVVSLIIAVKIRSARSILQESGLEVDVFLGSAPSFFAPLAVLTLLNLFIQKKSFLLIQILTVYFGLGMLAWEGSQLFRSDYTFDWYDVSALILSIGVMLLVNLGVEKATRTLHDKQSARA